MPSLQQDPPAFISRKVTEAHRFYLPAPPAPAAGLTVLCGGWERCAPDYRIQRRNFPYYCLEFVAGGSGRLLLDGRSHALRRGVVFAYGPECPHVIATDPSDCLLKYFVTYRGAAALALMAACGLSPGTCKAAAEADEVQAAFEQVVTHGRRPTRSATRVAALQLEVLLLRISDDSLPVRRQRQAYRTFARCRAYLDQHFLDVARAEEAAAACHVAPAYLSRLFARYCRESPYRYLLRKRMTRAADWLDDGRFLAREVADKLGMDPFHFSRVFKRVHGLAPAAFMQRRESLWGL